MILRNAKQFNRIVFFDLETTGFNIFHNEIIEIAAKDNYGNSWSSLIYTPKQIPAKITDITKINNSMLHGMPTIETGLNKLIKFIIGDNSEHNIQNIPDDTKPFAKYCIGHNALAFDYPFLIAQCKKYNIKFPEINVIDTMRLSQYTLPNNNAHSLNYLCTMFNITNENAHRAMSDVLSTESLFNNLLIIFKNYINDTSNLRTQELFKIIYDKTSAGHF